MPERHAAFADQMSDPSECLLGGLTLTALKHFGESTVVVDDDGTLCPDWRLASIGDVVLVQKPADDRSPKRIDVYEVGERSASGAAFRLDPARLVYSLRWKHNAHPPDFELVLVQDEPAGWANTANLTLLAELRRRAPAAIDWDEMAEIIPVLDAFEAARQH